MPRPLILPPDLANAPFSTREAKRRGLSDRQLRALPLQRPFHGVRSASAAGILAATAAYGVVARDGDALSGATAAEIWGLPVPKRLRFDETTQLEVLVARTGSRPQRRGVKARRLREDLVRTVTVDGRTLTTPALTWLLLARDLSIDELIMVGDALLTRADNYPGLHPRANATLEELGAEVSRAGRIPGIGTARRALERVRVGVESPMETVVRLAIEDAALGYEEPDVNAEIWDGDVFVARGDLVYRRRWIVVEYDGDWHRSEEQFQRDVERRNRLRALGWKVIVVTKGRARGGASAPFLEELRRELDSRRDFVPPGDVPPVRRNAQRLRIVEG